jgi:hypothetical protein
MTESQSNGTSQFPNFFLQVKHLEKSFKQRYYIVNPTWS